ncbi:MAG: pantoate--beta-alanine ligase [Crocinitomicaceae bacterium]|nr:pantoate--beta-alanine ligase [Crocinitomicaceae bacterium]
MVDLSVLTSVESLRDRLYSDNGDSTVSFVATMGALHHGHIELVKEASELADTVVLSIFVNPTQFNNKEDLINYPRTLHKDIELLEGFENVVVFAPPISEIYPDGYNTFELELGILERVMEGEFRPGHFKGVVKVVKRLFDIIEPDYALFGQKDFQQLAVIEYMTKAFKMPVKIVGCETVREPSGLASSSRNYRLSEKELIDAEIIFQTMEYVKTLVDKHSVQEAIDLANKYFEQGELRLEYLEIVHPETLEQLDEWVSGARLCMAAFCGEVRLIDNCAVC